MSQEKKNNNLEEEVSQVKEDIDNLVEKGTDIDKLEEVEDEIFIDKFEEVEDEIFIEKNTEDTENESEIIKNENDNKKKKNIKSTAIMASIGVLCLGFGFIIGKEKGRELPATWKNYSNSKVLATVGETQITEKELSYKMEPLFYLNGKEKLSEDEIKAYESSMIDYMTTTEVLYQEGKKEGIKVSKDDINTEYDTVIGSLTKSYGMTEEDLINKLEIPKEEIRKNIEKELIATKYIGQATEVSDKEVENYYKENKDEFLKVKASHILIKNIDEEGKPLSSEQKKKNEDKAKKILNKLKSGEDFAQLAKEYSEDSSASVGGDLGFFNRGKMVEEFEDAAFALKVGEITDKIVETEYGYHIIKKTDEEYGELEDIKEELKYNLSYQKQGILIDNLSEKYNVTIK